MRLAPGVFMWRHILRFGKISRASVLSRIQIAASHRHPVRCASMTMAGVVVRSRRENASKRVHPCARADAGLTRIQTGAVRIGAPWTEMRAGCGTGGVASKTALTLLQGGR